MRPLTFVPLCRDCGNRHQPDEKHVCYTCGEQIDVYNEDNAGGSRHFCEDCASHYRADGYELDEHGRWA